MRSATIQTIFVLGFAAFAATHPLPAFICTAAWCIMNCRTVVMGGHVQVCPEGHFQRNHYNSCKHRICPLCAFIQVQKWLMRQKARILACDHYHVIFTIPHQLNFLWPYNVGLMTDILFQCARQTIFQLLSDEKYLGAVPGVIASLHTWTKKLTLHPHIHCLVTGGGLNDGKWITLPYDYLFPFRVAAALFQGKVLSALLAAQAQGRLILPSGTNPRHCKRLLHKLWRIHWDVHIRDKYPHGKGVLTYLARYLRGGPITNRRIAKIEEDQVTFHVGREKKELLTLPIDEFIARYIQHVSPPGLVVIRSWGIYSASKRAELNTCRALLGQQALVEPVKMNWQDLLETIFATSAKQNQTPWLCPVCGKRLIVKSLIPAQDDALQYTKTPP